MLIATRAGNFLADFFTRLGGDRFICASRIPVLLAHADARKLYRRILVPVDFSDAGRESARMAIRLWPAAQVVFLHAFRVPDNDGTAGEEYSGEEECSRSLRAYERAMLELRRFCDGLVPAGRLASLVVHCGAPAPVICDYARRMEADLIAVGRARQSWLSELFHGNASRRLAILTSCDVLVTP